jgi:putative transposase
VKRSLLVEAQGGPLAVVTAGANMVDTKLLAATLDAIVIERPQSTARRPQHLALDKGYDNPTGHEAVEGRHYQTHIRRIGEETWDSTHRRPRPARRWVVERTHAWLSKCRAILVRYAKLSWVYLGLIKLACILLWYRCLHRLKRYTGF